MEEDAQDQHNQSNGSNDDNPNDDNEIITESSAVVRDEPLRDDKGPPKVDSEVEVLHEKVKKQVVKEGHGQKPAKFATCFLHYRAWVENSSHKFEDTWQEQRPVELILGKEKTEMTGLGIGVASMKSGEHALLHVGWELGYGKEGSFSFPNVPPMADLLYEVELIGYDEAKEGKARSDMTVEERIQAADGRKMEGNSYFKEEKLQEAMQQYEMVVNYKSPGFVHICFLLLFSVLQEVIMNVSFFCQAIAYMGDDFMFQLFGKYRDMALAVKNPCHLNMAACLIKLNQYEEAIGQCSIRPDK
ncbi:peptidyl-prolyl cis-trans isomerase FKBP42-like isoform X5 [Phoenix dactylifera]|uniref:peptidylprolyl isomerase n=1 Tax=Phoenix dactylifera TaxID=42345 RepID=A0A8B8ZJV9_PHODC|nr:peptidyl-prolyl cis-trans isomerase FKBP42-like isoform X5 [Phoenix dactylifera]